LGGIGILFKKAGCLRSKLDIVIESESDDEENKRDF
jgi:hypothetical protein